ncbi:hypothetical protein HDU86_002409 [Geranomyces michiganensis]|nr:hypothetical protein HDU86_002409 [Geranomyces michiganensis]
MLRGYREFRKEKAKQEGTRAAGVSWLASHQLEVENTTTVLSIIAGQKRKRLAADGSGPEYASDNETEAENSEDEGTEEDKAQAGRKGFAAEESVEADVAEEHETQGGGLGDDGVGTQTTVSEEDAESVMESVVSSDDEGTPATKADHEDKGAAGALHREYIAKHFNEIRTFKAKKEFVVENVNLSVLFCKVRYTLYQKAIERNEVIKIENATRHDVLPQHHILFRILTATLPQLSEAGERKSEIAIDLLHAKKVAELKLTDAAFLVRYRTLQVCRGLAFAINEQERRSAAKLTEDEDTTVHLWLHDLLVETL